MSATQRFWTSTSFDHAHQPANQHQITPANVEHAARMPARQQPGHKPSLSPAPGLSPRLPQHQPLPPQSTLRSSPALANSSSANNTGMMMVPTYMLPPTTAASPVISAPSTPVLYAKELPLAPSTVPPTPSSSGSLSVLQQQQQPPYLYQYSTSGSASPSPSPARPLPNSSTGVHPDMHYHPYHPTGRPLLFRHAHSRSNSFSSTNNVFPPSITSSPTPAPALALPNSTSSGIPFPTGVPFPSTSVPPTPASRRTSLITTSLANAVTNNLSLATGNLPGVSGGPPSSVPMSPASSYGLPSPTFPPRPLPLPGTAVANTIAASTPARPPRSPARPAGALGLTPLTSIPPSSLNSSPSPVPASATSALNSSTSGHNYNAPIPRPARPSTGPGATGLSMSRRNSRQVSVRLSAAFIAPPIASGAPSVPGSRSTSHSRAPTEVGDYDDFITSGRVSRAGSIYGNANVFVNGSTSDGVEILRQGDVIGQGCLLRGKIVKAVPPTLTSSPMTPVSAGASAIAAGARYEVVRSLGTGSYAVVYLVREILPPPPPPPTTAPGTPARSYLGLGGLGGLQPFTSTNGGDVFDEEDVFGMVHPSIPAFRSSSQRSTGVRRSSLLKPIDERSNIPSSPLSPTTPSSPTTEEPKYGREFAIKVLSKASLDRDELAVQMTEVTIHQSLLKHGNIVTLYGAMETDELLMLVLEYVRGEDLYYFLEQQQQEEQLGDNANEDGGMSSTSSSRRSSVYSTTSSSYSGMSDEMDMMGMDMDEFDMQLEPSRGRTRRARHHHHHDRSRRVPAAGSEGTKAAGTSGTPPTPSLLSNVHPAHMLSRERLKLIASMFAQMCDAVQACHAQGISHRDIKPENFIVTSDEKDRKVIVKLSDFGLATMDQFSADVDCGSAPYMSYECRNVVGPTYATQPADVWSLGIVLINMLYHHNLWQDTFEGDASFEAFRQQPIAFLMQRSPGMTHEVAEFLAERVFRILPEAPAADSDPALVAQYEEEVAHVRVTAGEFGEWARNLPALFYSAGTAAAISNASETSATVESKRLSFDAAVAAGLSHSPNCVHSQLHDHTNALAFTDEEEEAALEAMFADKTFTMSDVGRQSLDQDVETEADMATTPVLPSLLAQSQSSPSSGSSVPISPRSPALRTMTPLPAEPMPLAQPVVDVTLSDLNASTTSTNGECIACTYDEQLGLGLSGATNLNSADAEGEGEAEDPKRSPSGVRSRKRGQRRKKDASVAPSSAAPSTVSSPHIMSMMSLPNVAAGVGTRHHDLLEDLAQEAQNFAREISRTRPASTTRQRSTSRSRSRAPAVASPGHQTVPPLPALTLSHPPSDAVSPLDRPVLDLSSPSLPPSVAASVIPNKKASKWNLLAWRERDGPEPTTDRATNLLKSLDSTYHTPPASSGGSNGARSQTSSGSSFESVSRTPQRAASPPAHTPSTASSIAFTPPPLPPSMQVPNSSGSDSTTWRGRPQQRGWESTSPPFRSGLHERWDRSPASSTYSSRSNATTVPSWRNNQPASAASSVYNGSAPSSSASSTFTRFRNGSEMSFSTMATTVSASSAFNVGGAGGILPHQEKKPQNPPARPPSVKVPAAPPAKPSQQRRAPVNVKVMHGIPWELHELPRQMQPTVNGKMPMGDVHGAPPRRVKRNGGPAPKVPALDTITERPKGSRRATSPGGESGESDGSGSPVESHPQKKVQKAQINTLAKILTSFKAKRE